MKHGSKGKNKKEKNAQSIADFCKSDIFDKSHKNLIKLKEKTQKDLQRIEDESKDFVSNTEITPLLEETKKEIADVLNNIEAIEQFYNGLIAKKKLICKK